MRSYPSYPVPADEAFSLVDRRSNSDRVVFANFGPTNRSGYRSCGVFSCSPLDVRANLDAIKRGGVKVFDKFTTTQL